LFRNSILERIIISIQNMCTRNGVCPNWFFFDISRKTWQGWRNSLKYNLWCPIDLIIWCNQNLKDLISFSSCFLSFLSSSSTTLLMFNILCLCNGPFLITFIHHSLFVLLPMNVREWTLENYKLHVFLCFPTHYFHFTTYLKV